MLTKQNFIVQDKGELVVFKLGNLEFSFEFQVALEISAMLRREARYAKLTAGFDAKKRTVMGVLEDAAAPKKRESRWRKALPERLKARQIIIEAVGTVVKARFGRTIANFDFRGAFQISQALRVHGKLARNAAGEKANWADLVKDRVLVQ